MAKPKLLVTGGAGFIGSHVVQAAYAAGYEVAVFDLTGPIDGAPDWAVPHDVRWFFGDLRDRTRVFGVLGVWAPDYVSHHAALIDSPGSCANPSAHFETNVMGSINLLDACAAVGTVKRIVFASSAAVYGDVPLPRVAQETDRPTPDTPYGVGKLAVEQLFTAMYPHSGIECVALRYPNVYGPRARHGVVAKFIQAALAGEDLRIQLAAPDCGWDPRQGTQRQYVYVEDVARVNVRALGAHIIGCNTYNVPGTFGSTATVASKIIERIMGESRVVLRVSTAPHVQGDVSRSFMLAGRFFEEIMQQGSLTSMSSGLKKTIEWWKGREP